MIRYMFCGLLIGSFSITASAQNIYFGDDSGEYTHDDECDDPRFVGAGRAAGSEEDDPGEDASDCRKLFHTG